jgi:hypothetical protein
MDSTVLTVIQQMGTTTIGFVGDVVTNLWPLFLSLAVLAFSGSFILRKTGIGRR